MCQEWLRVSSRENRSLFLTPPSRPPPTSSRSPGTAGAAGAQADAAHPMLPTEICPPVPTWQAGTFLFADTRKLLRRTLVPRPDTQTTRAMHNHALAAKPPALPPPPPRRAGAAGHAAPPRSPCMAWPWDAVINLNRPVARRASVCSRGGVATGASASAAEFRVGVQRVSEMEEESDNWVCRWKRSQRLS